MSLRRGIEPIIATVILVAVALIIAVAVVGYLMGLFGGLAGGSPQISIPSVRATLEGTNIKFEVYVNNAGPGSDKLLKAEVVVGGKSNSVTTGSGFASVESGSQLKVESDHVFIPGNQKGWVTITIRPPTGITVSTGDSVILRLYFERSGVHTIQTVVTLG